MNRLFSAPVMLVGLLTLPHHASAQDTDNKAQIAVVVETFRTAIINKDEEAFLKLFLKEDITWAGVTTDASIERLYANRPEPGMKRPFKTFTSSPRRFISSIAKDKAKISETISNLHIDSDGDVGQV